MAIAIRQPIMANVDDRAQFIKCLLTEYPYFLKSYQEKQSKNFAEIAKENAEGDEDIERDIYNSFKHVFDDDGDKTNLFYQSVFVMCFSYYESCIAYLSKEANSKEHIKAICSSKNINLSKEVLTAIDDIQNEMNVLRNNICHNNMGTLRKKDILKKISEEYSGVFFDGDTIMMTDSKIIKDTLDKMHMVLHELCGKLGYKTKYIGK